VKAWLFAVLLLAGCASRSAGTDGGVMAGQDAPAGDNGTGGDDALTAHDVAQDGGPGSPCLADCQCADGVCLDGTCQDAPCLDGGACQGGQQRSVACNCVGPGTHVDGR
jgi:hypothetical protein